MSVAAVKAPARLFALGWDLVPLGALLDREAEGPRPVPDGAMRLLPCDALDRLEGAFPEVGRQSLSLGLVVVACARERALHEMRLSIRVPAMPDGHHAVSMLIELREGESFDAFLSRLLLTRLSVPRGDQASAAEATGSVLLDLTGTVPDTALWFAPVPGGLIWAYDGTLDPNPVARIPYVTERLAERIASHPDLPLLGGII